jgi:hypothetical protein
VPNNVYDLVPGDRLARHVRVLVELGSHAMAPDVDGDARFVPEHDVTPAAKMIWGIRDRGATASRYRETYSDQRGADAIELSLARPSAAPPVEFDAGSAARPAYELEHVDALESRFDQLGLGRHDLGAAFGVPVGWFKRLFGKSTGAEAKLFRPAHHQNYGAPHRLRRGHAREIIGVGAGVSNILSSHTFFLSGRYAWLNPSPFTPDLTLEGQAILTAEGTDFYAVELLGSYPVDAITRVFGGVGLLTDDVRFRHRQLDWITGFEVTLGRIRLRKAFRSTGSVNRSGWSEFRAEWKAW